MTARKEWHGKQKKLCKQKIKKVAIRNVEIYRRYKEKRRDARNLIKRSKERMWSNFGNKLTKAYHENRALFYNTVKQMRKPKTNMLRNIKNKNRSIITKEEEISKKWKEYSKDLLKETEIEIKYVRTESKEDNRKIQERANGGHRHE